MLVEPVDNRSTDEVISSGTEQQNNVYVDMNAA